MLIIIIRFHIQKQNASFAFIDINIKLEFNFIFYNLYVNYSIHDIHFFHINFFILYTNFDSIPFSFCNNINIQLKFIVQIIVLIYH